MNKFFGLLPLLLSVASSISAQSFTKLEPVTTKGAMIWNKNEASKLNADELSLFNTYFLLTANPAEENIEQLISCVQSIQKNPKTAAIFEIYQSNAAEIIQTYIHYLENKLANLKSAPEDSETIIAKLEAKVYELFAYISSIYYDILNSFNNPKDTDPATTTTT